MGIAPVEFARFRQAKIIACGTCCDTLTVVISQLGFVAKGVWREGVSLEERLRFPALIAASALSPR
jgi:hypothetical protein